MAMSHSHQYIFWLYLIYSGITALVTVVANICLHVTLLARRTMSLVHDFIITVSILGQVKELGSTQLAIQIMCLSFMQCDQRVDVFVYLS